MNADLFHSESVKSRSRSSAMQPTSTTGNQSKQTFALQSVSWNNQPESYISSTAFQSTPPYDRVMTRASWMQCLKLVFERASEECQSSLVPHPTLYAVLIDCVEVLPLRSISDFNLCKGEKLVGLAAVIGAVRDSKIKEFSWEDLFEEVMEVKQVQNQVVEQSQQRTQVVSAFEQRRSSEQSSSHYVQGIKEECKNIQPSLFNIPQSHTISVNVQVETPEDKGAYKTKFRDGSLLFDLSVINYPAGQQPIANILASLIEENETLTQIRVLQCSSLPIVGLLGLNMLQSLVVLNMSNCNLGSRSDCLKSFQSVSLPQVQLLNLASNNLKSIYLKGRTLPNLSELVLSNNDLTSTECLAALTNLVLLDLSFNQIANFETLSSLSNLTFLAIQGNKTLFKTRNERIIILESEDIPECSLFGSFQKHGFTVKSPVWSRTSATVFEASMSESPQKINQSYQSEIRSERVSERPQRNDNDEAPRQITVNDSKKYFFCQGDSGAIMSTFGQPLGQNSSTARLKQIIVYDKENSVPRKPPKAILCKPRQTLTEESTDNRGNQSSVSTDRMGNLNIHSTSIELTQPANESPEKKSIANYYEKSLRNMNPARIKSMNLSAIRMGHADSSCSPVRAMAIKDPQSSQVTARSLKSSRTPMSTRTTQREVSCSPNGGRIESTRISSRKVTPQKGKSLIYQKLNHRAAASVSTHKKSIDKSLVKTMWSKYSCQKVAKKTSPDNQTLAKSSVGSTPRFLNKKVIELDSNLNSSSDHYQKNIKNITKKRNRDSCRMFKPRSNTTWK